MPLGLFFGCLWNWPDTVWWLNWTVICRPLFRRFRSWETVSLYGSNGSCALMLALSRQENSYWYKFRRTGPRDPSSVTGQLIECSKWACCGFWSTITIADTPSVQSVRVIALYYIPSRDIQTYQRNQSTITAHFIFLFNIEDKAIKSPGTHKAAWEKSDNK